MNKKAIVGFVMSIFMLTIVGNCAVDAQSVCDAPKQASEVGCDLKPVIYLYPKEDNTPISVRLDYDGNLYDLIPEFNAENTWNITANIDGKITFEGQTYDYLFWEGDPNYSYDFYSGFCVKGEETESFLNEKLRILGLNDDETAEFIDFWLPMMQDNEYNVISFQGASYYNGAMLTVSPEPDSVVRVFMAWYPSDRYIKINPQYLETPGRGGFTLVEWGGNRVQ